MARTQRSLIWAAVKERGAFLPKTSAPMISRFFLKGKATREVACHESEIGRNWGFASESRTIAFPKWLTRDAGAKKGDDLTARLKGTPRETTTSYSASRSLSMRKAHNSVAATSSAMSKRELKLASASPVVARRYGLLIRIFRGLISEAASDGVNSRGRSK